MKIFNRYNECIFVNSNAGVFFRLNAIEFQYLFSQTYYSRNKWNYLDYLLLIFLYIISKQLPQNLLNPKLIISRVTSLSMNNYRLKGLKLASVQ